jgi:AcrR family transcriptional regulator
MSSELEEILSAKLPAGRHGLDREAVAAHQRRRLLAATALSVAESGYGELTVGEITRRASISRVTFYQLFEGKTEILVAAYEEAFAALRGSVAAPCGAHEDWPQRVIAGVGGAIAFAVASPARASLLCAEPVGLQPELAVRIRAARTELAAMLRRARELAASGPEPYAGLPPIAEEALIGGACTIVAAHLAEGRSAELAGLAPELAQVILTPYLGAEAAAALLAATPHPGPLDLTPGSKNHRVS